MDIDRLERIHWLRLLAERGAEYDRCRARAHNRRWLQLLRRLCYICCFHGRGWKECLGREKRLHCGS
jgi:hypothetical protein